MTYEGFILDRPIGRRPRLTGARPAIGGGSQRGLAFTLDWSGPGLEGDLSFAVANEQVWSTAGSPLREDLWLRLLTGLADAWIYILLQETYPRGISPDAPSRTEVVLAERVINVDEAKGEAERFRCQHDLSAWIAPERALPSLWLMREGNFMLLESGGRVFRWAYSDVTRTLGELGDHIAKRAQAIAAGRDAARRWRARDQASESLLEQIALGVDQAKLARLHESLPARSRSEIFRGVDEVRAAARMLAYRVPDSMLVEIVKKIQSEPHRDAPLLREWSEKAVAELDLVRDELPRIQGRHIARWLRKALSNRNGRVNPEQLLATWGVAVTPFPTARHIEAISFWGSRHGPAILRNPASKRSGGWGHSAGLFGGQRFTLAHELAHLLLDIDGALPVAEVLGGSLPRTPEERANAFAAEVLLPEDLAGDEYKRAPELADALRTLTTRFGVTKTLAAYQILKRFGESSPAMSPSDRAELERIVR